MINLDVTGSDVIGGLILAARVYVAAKAAWRRVRRGKTVQDSFDLEALRDELVTDEGRKLSLYIDTTGNASIGIGRNLSGVGISPDEMDLMFANDVARAAADLDRNAAWWRGLPARHQRVMLNLCFNMGWPRLAGFRKFLGAMTRHAWADAGRELQDSVWWHQVGTRGPRIVARLVGDAPHV